MSSQPPGRYHRRSCICENYELRITHRCSTEDLGQDPSLPFEEARRHPIVGAFERERCDTPIGTTTVGPEAGPDTIYVLRHTDDHRGATWHDQANRVVWLCAYGLHRSGEPTDAFPYFQELLRTDRIKRTQEDLEDLFEDRGHRFAETIAQDAQTLLALARSLPGEEQSGILGSEENAGVVVEIVDTLEETYVAFSLARMDYTRIVMVLRSFFPSDPFSNWELVAHLPTRPLDTDAGEVCYRILHE